jgi:hypothetical protein
MAKNSPVRGQTMPMTAIFCNPGFSARFVPAFSATRIALKAGLVGKPDIDIAPVEPLLKFLQKRFAQLLILFVGPWHIVA